MSQRIVVLGMALVLSIVFVVLGLSEAAYLQRGYAISTSLGDGPATLYREPFPVWLKAGHALTALGALTSLMLCAMLRPAAAAVAWAAFVSATVVGLYDVRQYGTIGTPTSLKSYLLILGIAVLVTYWRRKGVLRA